MSAGRQGLWRSIRVRLVIVYTLLLLFSLQLIGAYFVRALTGALIHSDTQQAKNQAQVIATIVVSELTGGQGKSNPPPLLAASPQLADGVAYVLSPDGVVRDTSAGAALIGQKRIDSVAAQTLVNHTTAVAVHYDSLSDQHLLSVAVPVESQGNFLGVVELVVPVQASYVVMRKVTTIFYTGTALTLALATLLGGVLTGTIAQPVVEVTRQARKMAAGDFSQRVAVRSDDEFGELSAAINHLADGLQDALAVGARERERLHAVIKYMGDGVLALDVSGVLMFKNDAATQLLDGAPEDGQGLSILGLTRKDLLQVKGDRAFIRPLGEALVHVHVTEIRKEGDLQAQGYVALLRDVTEQERVQGARRDFVANVSHELRTPLTTIKSYMEALAEDPEPATRQHFLEVVAEQTERMIRLTQDLLLLSGLEKGGRVFNPRPVNVQAWLRTAVERFQLQARAQGVELRLQIAPHSPVIGDRDMLDRILDNLLSNALKYTAYGGTVTLRSWAEQDVLVVEVADTGTGIPSEDLPHVFERFYRVDKGRSRKMGGSG
ncbi:HAMP domain-containing protein, partial [Alicyclobacillaceae bacterium I2511]